MKFSSQISLLLLCFLMLPQNALAQKNPQGEKHTVSLSNNRNWVWQRSIPEGDLIVWEKTPEGREQILEAMLDCMFCAGKEDNCNADGIQVLELTEYSAPVFVVVGHVGAHSQQILIFDPSLGNDPIFKRVGYFFVSHSADKKRLTISYDRPGTTEECETEENAKCYVEQTIEWPGE